MPRFVTIQLTGIQDNRKTGDPLVVYGFRTEDVANRVVGISLRPADANEVMSQAHYLGTMPQIEVDNRHWFYVAAIGKSSFEEGKGPVAP